MEIAPHLGNINLSPMTSSFYQNIYASENYGVFFGVFGKFVYDKNQKRISSIDLELMNYKGPHNMELVNYEIEIVELKGNKDLLPINLQHIECHKMIGLMLHIKVATNNTPTTQMKIKESDLANLHCDKNDLFIVVKSLRALNGDTQEEFDEREDPDQGSSSYPDYPAYVNGIFDTEFYYRNGFLIDKKSKNDNTLNTIGKKDKGLFNIDSKFDGSPSCRQRISLITVAS